MILAEIETWPLPLLEYLSSQHQMLLAHARHDRDKMDAYLHHTHGHVPISLMPSNPHVHARERAALKIHELIQSTTLRGWHCTRLTEHEVKYIKSHGMQPPNLHVLTEQIRQVQADGTIDREIAERLIAKNQADEDCRKGMIWFCFFDPASEDQSGIECFFRYWGGEALYNFHEHDPTYFPTSPAEYLRISCGCQPA